MNATFTPGPWVMSRNGCDIEIGVSHPVAQSLAIVLIEDLNGENPVEANANLIAAAPDLYAACEAFVKAGNMSAFSAQANAALAKAHDVAIAATAKARGEPA